MLDKACFDGYPQLTLIFSGNAADLCRREVHGRRVISETYGISPLIFVGDPIQESNILFASPAKISSTKGKRPDKVESIRESKQKAADVGDIHRLLKEQGKEAALKSDFARDVIEAAAGYLASEDTEIGFLSWLGSVRVAP